jgi:hypothetical protein
VIDNREQVERLLDKLKASLPLSAAVTPELGPTIRQQSPGIELPQQCRVTRVDYAGDDGGIVCALDFGQVEHREALVVVSMTQLRFAGTAPLSREIAAYQKHRVKRLRRLGTDRARGPFRG